MSGTAAAQGSVPALVGRWAAHLPQEAAADHEGQRLTYRQLALRAGGVAARLHGQGVRQGEVVAVWAGRGGPALAAQLGIWLAGGVSLLLDPAQGAGRLAAVLEDAGPTALLAAEDAPLPEQAAGPACVIPLAEVSDAPPHFDRPGVGSGPAYLVYTSGSSGTPKGVLVGHESFAALCRWHRDTYDVRPGVRASSVAAMSFDAYQWEVWPYLSGGAAVSFAPPEVRFSPWELDAWFRAERVDLAFLPTPLAEAYVRHGTRFEQLRALLTGGDLLRLADGHPLRRFVNHYGPTEATVVTTAGPVAPGLAGAASIGRAIAPARTLVADGEREVAPGEAGELLISGRCLALGYWRDPAATRAAFVTLPGRPGRWYRSGDLVRQEADGAFRFLGRTDRQLKVRGVRVEPGEVEGVLGAHPALEDVVIDLDASGGGLTAFVVRTDRPGPAPTTADLQRFAADRLPPEMRPRTFHFVAGIPVTEHGKVDRGELNRRAFRERSDSALK